MGRHCVSAVRPASSRGSGGAHIAMPVHLASLATSTLLHHVPRAIAAALRKVRARHSAHPANRADLHDQGACRHAQNVLMGDLPSILAPYCARNALRAVARPKVLQCRRSARARPRLHPHKVHTCKRRSRAPRHRPSHDLRLRSRTVPRASSSAKTR